MNMIKNSVPFLSKEISLVSGGPIARVGVPFLICTKAPRGLQVGMYPHLGGIKQPAQDSFRN